VSSASGGVQPGEELCQLERPEILSREQLAAAARRTTRRFGGAGAGQTWRGFLRLAQGDRQQTPAVGEVLCPHAIGQQPEVADAHEAGGNRVQQKPTEELISVQRHDAGPVGTSIVLVLEGDRFIIHRHESSVGDGDAVGVAGQVLEHLLGAAEGRLGVDDPIVFDRCIQQPLEGIVALRADQLAALACAFEQIDELAAEDFGESPAPAGRSRGGS
jgi:hypothetical protein